MTDKDGDGIDDDLFDSFFSFSKKPSLPIKKTGASPIIVPSSPLPPAPVDSFVQIKRRALVKHTPKNLAMWNIIFSLLTVTRKF
jgi:hypothetical protein